jgi:indole-3-glycerol phosphate synthase
VKNILQDIIAQKQIEVARSKQRVDIEEWRCRAREVQPPRDFCAAIRGARGIALIAEVKKASPSQGVIRADFEPVSIARTYAEAGAHCLSVLTDEPFFQGHLHYLRMIRAAVELPILRKDFVIDEYQVIEARAAGADAVLLIAECLSADELRHLHQSILDWRMTPLVELYDEMNLDAVLSCQPRLVGVNNRNLNSFQVDLQHSIRLRKKIPQEILFVSESGIGSTRDVAELTANGVDAMLVGESLMRQPDLAAAVKNLLGN